MKGHIVKVACLVICIGRLECDKLGDIILSQSLVNPFLQAIVVVDDRPNVCGTFSCDALTATGEHIPVRQSLISPGGDCTSSFAAAWTLSSGVIAPGRIQLTPDHIMLGRPLAVCRAPHAV